MTNYTASGYYEDESANPEEKERVDVNGTLRADSALICETGVSAVRGSLRYNLPGVPATELFGYASSSTRPANIFFVLRPSDETYVPSLFYLIRPDEGEGLEGCYIGSWIPLAKDLVELLSEIPSPADIKDLYERSRREYGTRRQGAELVLTSGKIARIRRRFRHGIKELASILSPEPNPEPT